MFKEYIRRFKIFYSELDNDKRVLFWVLTISTFITVVFLIKLLCNGFFVFGQSLQMDSTGQFGDFIGGVIGTIFSGLGFYFLYVTLVEQRKSIDSQNGAIDNQKEAFQRERFESKFFDLIRLHRENVSEQNYTKFGKINFEVSHGRKVFRIIQKEFDECYTEVCRFHKIYGEDFVRGTYLKKIQAIITDNDLRVKPIEFILIDLTYTILFFGVAKDSKSYLTNRFKQKFNNDFFSKLVVFLQLKPKREMQKRYACWKHFIQLPIKEIKEIFEIIHENRRVESYQYRLRHINFFSNLSVDKYYGGHQHRLGHYYRHLFQSYKFLLSQEFLKDEEKYLYGKTLRAQLSTYEQSLLFLNSISQLGQKWDLAPEIDLVTKKEIKLITTFQLIKNVSGVQLMDIYYKNYYPKVIFEFEDN